MRRQLKSDHLTTRSAYTDRHHVLPCPQPTHPAFTTVKVVKYSGVVVVVVVVVVVLTLTHANVITLMAPSTTLTLQTEKSRMK